MKALSIRQPWAWLIVNGFKDVENRNWPTKLRGDILIHAGKTIDPEGYAFVERAFPEIQLPKLSELETGGIVGRARLVDCVERSDSPWFFGNYGFVLEGAGPLPFRPCRGLLYFFEVPEHLVEA